MSKATNPTFVIIRDQADDADTGSVYRVHSVIKCESRGREYRLANKRGLIARVCHAPAEHLENIRSCYTGGEVLTYCRAKSGETFHGMPLADAVEA